MAETVEEVRKTLIGKKVGESVALSDGGSLKIEEIYAKATGKPQVAAKPKKAKKAPPAAPPAN